jgi:hypothetical protein
MAAVLSEGTHRSHGNEAISFCSHGAQKPTPPPAFVFSKRSVQHFVYPFRSFGDAGQLAMKF